MDFTRPKLMQVFLYISLIIVSLCGLCFSVSAKSLDNQSVVTVLTIQGPIGPAVQNYIERGIKKSAEKQAKAILLLVDTPGGLSTAMRGMIKSILVSKIPVISYVYPRGARAASAGTYILYASHIAAMAPGTNLGAATPVNMISPKGLWADDKKGKVDKEPEQSASELKSINDAKAYIRSLAELRGRNAKWAIKAVVKGDSLSAKEALQHHVIDLMAPSVPALLKAVNGQTVSVNSNLVSLQLTHPKLIHIKPDWRSKVLHIITSPSIAYILLMIGIYGLFFEFMNPGYVLPGVIGGIALLLALYSFQMLPVNYVGFMLVILGVIFMVAEAFVPSFGALGFGGVIGFLLGSFLLFDTNTPGYSLPWQLIIGVTITTAIFMIGLIQLLWRSRRKQVVSGVEGMIGALGVIQKDEQSCWAIVYGEHWRVRSELPLSDQQAIRVTKVDGLTLVVEPIEK